MERNVDALLGVEVAPEDVGIAGMGRFGEFDENRLVADRALVGDGLGEGRGGGEAENDGGGVFHGESLQDGPS